MYRYCKRDSSELNNTMERLAAIGSDETAASAAVILPNEWRKQPPLGILDEKWRVQS